MTRRRSLPVVAVALATTAAACGRSATEPAYPPERARFSCNSPGPVVLPPSYPFAFTFDSPARAERGTSLTFTLTVRNVSTAIAHLWTILPEQALNVVVRREDDRTVWDRRISETDGIVVLVARSLPVPPGQPVSYQVRWDQIGLNGRAVPPGRYQVFATLWSSLYTGSDFAGYADAMSEPCSFRSEVRTLDIDGS